MRIDDIVWLPHFVDKLAWKHQVVPEEVEEVLLFGNPQYRKVQKGHVPGENLYAAYGQTLMGRYLVIFFVYKLTHEALIISARTMDAKEKRQYAKK
ncbi:MAG: BrnT family toxin [Deltaproteobacteria bacterium]|nr:BrnT family toxin [Deltaproteobacteria bacterium]